MASFMSGMAGNVTAFNTVWTYDIYQSYIKPGQSDKHYLRMGHAATVGGILLSVAAAYANDPLQQHHGHAAADLRLRERAALRHVPARHVLEAHHGARRLLRPAHGHGGRGAASCLTLTIGNVAGIKGGFLGSVLHTYPSEMAQNFWTAIVAWSQLLPGDDRDFARDGAQKTTSSWAGSSMR